jgi:hypothetical protein
MRYLRASPLLLALAIGCASSRSGDGESVDADQPDRLLLYSIDGREGTKVNDRNTEGSFYGYPVLGKVEITDATTRKQLLDAIKDAIRRRPEMAAKCYWPRHGMRASINGKTVDYVICFECFRYEEFVDGVSIKRSVLNSDVEPIFSKPLVDAGIPIAPR